MKCEICHLHDASRVMKRPIDGVESELYVCDECARTAATPSSVPESSLPAGVPRSVTDVLFSMGLPVSSAKDIPSAVCPVCGLSRGDLREKRRLGCPHCFEVFGADIRTFLSEQVPVGPAAGNSPVEAVCGREVAKTRADLDRAVAEERFEDAARLSRHLAELKREEPRPRTDE
ncbi:MAG: hypothetical protein IJS46_01875 [Kiritimatiellae bacterium]|nr:hypothetical protein [Kiritimatiellia bacterium]